MFIISSYLFNLHKTVQVGTLHFSFLNKTRWALRRHRMSHITFTMPVGLRLATHWLTASPCQRPWWGKGRTVWAQPVSKSWIPRSSLKWVRGGPCGWMKRPLRDSGGSGTRLLFSGLVPPRISWRSASPPLTSVIQNCHPSHRLQAPPASLCC